MSNKSAKFKIGIDLGGTKIEGLLSEEKVLNVKIRKRIPTEKEKGYESIIEKIKALIGELSVEIPKGAEYSIGLGMPGSPHPKTGIVRNANTTVLNGRNFKADLEEALGHEIFIANDANCLTLSESTFGAARNFDRVCGIIMGTGFGGGVYVDGKVLTGANGNAGEWGHASLSPYGEKCWCGRNGCYELSLSGTGLANNYFKKWGEKVSAAKIFEGYAQGDEKCLQTMERFLDVFGDIFANIMRMFRPQAIVFGGGLSNQELLFTEGRKVALGKMGFTSYKPEFLKNELGDSSGIFGAALLPDMDQGV